VIREPAEELRFFRQTQRAGRQLRPDDALVEVVVEALRSLIDLHAGHPLGEVVDHVVALRLTVGDDVDTGGLLVLDRRFADGVVHLVEVATAQSARQVFVFRALEPLGHRIAPDDRGWKNRQ
jgi:hypothetical protein